MGDELGDAKQVVGGAGKDARGDGGEAADNGVLDQGIDAKGSVQCEDKTCAADEYCLIECLCCGVFAPDAAIREETRSECKKIPQGCDPANICGCPGIPQSCSSTDRVVHLLCA